MAKKLRLHTGIIGLGIIGSRVAANLRAAGFQVYVWNRTPKPAPNFLASPAEIAELCDTIQLFVADAVALFEVLDALGNTLSPRHTIICSATVGPDATVEAAGMVQACGAKFLDAPFTGSKVAAEKRELVYYIGGDDETFRRAEPVLKPASKAIVKIGGIGQAATLKVVTNMIGAVTVQTLAEACAIVKRSGIELNALSAALEHHGVRSGIIDMKLPKIIAGDYDTHFSVKHMFKDVQFGIQAANTFDIDIPATTATAGALYGAINSGWADLDFSALAKFYEEPKEEMAAPQPDAVEDMVQESLEEPAGEAPETEPPPGNEIDNRDDTPQEPFSPAPAKQDGRTLEGKLTVIDEPPPTKPEDAQPADGPEVSDAEAEAEFQKALRMMGVVPDEDQGRMQVVRRKRKKLI